MKKFLLILCALVCGTFAFAQTGTYTDNLHVTVNGDDEGVQQGTVTIAYQDETSGVIDFTLHDFSVDIYLSGALTSLYLGDVTVYDVLLGEEVDGVATFSCTEDHNVVYPDVDTDYASMISDVTVNMTGDLSETKLHANMEITVSLSLMGLIPLGDYPITATFGYDYGEYLVVNAETGYYLGGGLDWGTHATEIGKPQFFSFIEGTDGTYTLNGHQGSSTSIGWSELYDGIYVDAVNPLTWTVTESGEGYTFYNSTYGYLTGHGFQTAVTIETTAGSTAVWKLVTMDEVIATMDDATSDIPVDVTPLIPAPEPKRNNWGGSWTATGYGVSADPGNFSFGQDWNTASCAESYHSANGFDAHQTFSLPKAGFYTLTAQAFYRNDGSSTIIPSIYVTTGTSATDASGTLTSMPLPELTTTASSMETAYQEFLKELHPVSITFMIDNEGDEITVGFESNTGEDDEMWTIFGELGLTYSGEYYPTLAAVEGMMNADVEATQTSALAAYASSPSSATYSAALNAIAAAEESIAYYEEVTDALASYDWESVVATFDEAGKTAFQTDFLDAYDARTLTVQTIEDGLSAACKLQITEGCDMSYALKNSGIWVDAVGTTTANGTDNSSTYMQMCPQLPTAHEIYQYNATDWKVTGRDVTEVKAIYKQVDGLPAGTYKLSFYAYGNVGEEPTNGRPLVYANNADEQEVAYLADLGYAWTEASLYSFVCEVGEDGILEFGMKTQGDGYWYVMEECSLQYGVAEAEVVHEEEAEFAHWSIAPTGGGTFQYNTWSTEDDPSGMKTPFIEYWVGSGNRLGDATISHQTLTELAQGYYVVSMDMRAFNENSLNKIEPGIVLSANGTSVDVSLGTHDVFNKVSAVAYGTYEVPCLVGEDGTLDIAITLTDANCDWLAFKNVKVTYMGTEYELPAVDEVTAVEGDMSIAKNEAQQAAIAAYAASQTPATAIDLYQALTDAQLCANFYADVAATLEELDLDEAGQAAWAATENGAAYEAKTLEVTDMTDAYMVAAKAQTTEGKDITLVIEDSEWIGHTGTYQTGWEVYNGSGLGEGKILYQHIDGLVAGGTYEVSFYAAANVARDLDTSVWAGDGIAQVFANDETEDITVGTLSALDDIAAEEYKHTLTAQADEDGVLEFGMQNVKAGGQWYVAQGISLTILGTFEPKTVTYTDNLHVMLGSDDEGVVVTTVDVEYTAANVINFTLHDLAVSTYNVGNVTVTGITLEDAGDGVYTFSYSGNDVTVSGGDFDALISLVTITIDISGEISEDKLRANMTVDVKMFGASLLSITADFGYSYEDYLIVNAATGNYLGGGLDWGTHATELGKPQFFTFAEQADGTYKLDGHQGGTSIGWSELYDGIYVDAVNPLTWTVTESGEGYTFYNSTYGYLTGHGFQTAVTIETTAGSTAIWKLVTKDEILASMADATLDNPVDVTALIPAPEPKRNNWGNSWVATGYNTNADPTNYAFGWGSGTANCAESYCSENGFDIRQTIPSLPAGYYVLTAQAFYRNEGTGTVVPVMYVDEETTEIPVLTTSANNMGEAYQEFLNKQHTTDGIGFTVDTDDTDVLVGFTSLTTNNGMWTIFGELELLYYGLDAPEPEPESSAYVFVCTDWGSIDLGRVTDDNVTYDETNNTITVVASGTNNVALSNGREAPFTTANMTVTNKQCWYTVVGTNISTASGDSKLWWMNGANWGEWDPTSVVELDDGQVLVTWDLSTMTEIDVNLQDDVNYLDGWTGFGITSTTGTSVISDINFYTKDEISAMTGGVATRIDTVETAISVEDGAIYDLSGRKVSKAVKGIYIVDGKKVLVK